MKINKLNSVPVRALKNTVSATSAALTVLTNPWRKHRKSFTEKFHSSMKNWEASS